MLILDQFSNLAPDYDIVLCDIYGVVHDGISAFWSACDALSRFRDAGGSVVFITNAPRPRNAVIEFLKEKGLPPTSYDSVVTSGDVTQSYIRANLDKTICRVGPSKDTGIYLNINVTFAPVETADYVICSGLRDDENETPEDYRDLLTIMRERRLLMVCANPDLQVKRGSRQIYCAGAIAGLYRTLGGEVLYFGKPHPAIYTQALGVAAQLRRSAIRMDRILAIGDSIATDLIGAAKFGVDFLFVTSGLHSNALGGSDNVNMEALHRIVNEAKFEPKYVTRQLAW